MVDAPFRVIAAVIDKVKLVDKYANPWSPYEIALHFCLERLHMFMRESEQAGRRIHVVFECRGKEEDESLELAFRRIVAGESHWGYRNHDFSNMEFEPRFAKKGANSTGLQLADLTARPLALKTLRPDQANRTHSVLSEKAYWIKEFPWT